MAPSAMMNSDTKNAIGPVPCRLLRLPRGRMFRVESFMATKIPGTFDLANMPGIVTTLASSRPYSRDNHLAMYFLQALKAL